ncbi:hypothetical protein MOF38_21850 [Bacillus haynesii]|uniref:hypothetical protein n=1 Tax=Bacillus haynesii TaxID=1925021 RepID=UPI00227E65B5|nr:hypothetical protein [Bacillus haynesii]MCY9402396.1 hypothetical protein [Bacillus haynesii]
MKKVFFASLLAMLLLAFSLNAAPVSAKENASGNQQTPQVEYYDANDNLVAVSNLKGKSVTTTQKMSVKKASFYQWGYTVFSNYVWVKKGSAFKNPGAMSVELANKPKQFEVRMYASNKKTYIGKGVVKNASGWVPFDWRPLRKKGNSYTFKLVSAANSGRIVVNNGDLEYNVN